MSWDITIVKIHLYHFSSSHLALACSETLLLCCQKATVILVAVLLSSCRSDIMLKKTI